jgi:succinate-semialdehyde dehydrogenase/glutarate-semialdehyde dehydrogenase
VFEGAGKDPFLVLDRASLPAAAAALARAGCYNAGQACTAPERAYIPADCFDDFVDLAAAHASRLCAGDPADPTTDIGPVSVAVAQRLAGQVREAIDRGAAVVLSGRSVPVRVGGEDRVLVPPTVLAGVDPDCALMHEETFGPVLPICRVSTLDDAVDLAERSRYGLSATVFGADDGPARTVAARLARTHGQVFVGETWLEHRRRLPLAPYGGRRLSGWVWEWDCGQFVRRDGPRSPVSEFSLPVTKKGRPVDA